MDEKPLITFAVRLFNCERFVRDALQGAFSQNYRPLEIVIGDDSSSDESFRIAQEEVRHYEGPHEVILFKTDRNLGCGGALQEIFHRAKGEIIVVSDGDDVSHPERVQASYDAFHRHDAALVCVVCRGQWIDFEGRKVPGATLQHEMDLLTPLALAGGAGVMGGLAAFRRRVFEIGQPLHGLRQQEDRALGFRALCIGRIGEVPNVLMDRRVHMHNSSGPAARLGNGRANREWLLRNLREQMAANSFILQDGALLCAQGYLTRPAFEQIASLLRGGLRRLRLSRALWCKGCFQRTRLSIRLMREGMTARSVLRLLLQLFVPSLAVVLLRRNPAYQVAVRQQSAASTRRPQP